jgi:hypothetical protein
MVERGDSPRNPPPRPAGDAAAHMVCTSGSYIAGEVQQILTRHAADKSNAILPFSARNRKIQLFW